MIGSEACGRHAIVLAAGSASRFGSQKLLAQYQGQALISWSVQAALRAPVEGVTVVLAPGAAEVQAVAEATRHAAGRAPPLRSVIAPDAHEGMGASLRAGVRSLAPGARAMLLYLGDMPRVPHVLGEQLLQALDDGCAAAAPVCHGRRGHPVAFAASLLPDLERLSGDQGARAILAGLGDRLRLVPTEDDGVLFDIDRPQDLDRA